jgi:GNAT superfamily N-acetyltransferase
LNPIIRPFSVIGARHRLYGTYGLVHRIYSKVAGRVLDLEVLHIFGRAVADAGTPDPGTCLVIPPDRREEHEEPLRTVGAWERFSSYPAETVAVVAVDPDGTACGRLLVHPTRATEEQTDLSAWWVMAVLVEEAYRGRRHYEAMLDAASQHVREIEGEDARLHLFTHSYNQAGLKAVKRHGFQYRYTRVRLHRPGGVTRWFRWPYPRPI